MKPLLKNDRVRLFVAGALGMWLGTHALRAYLAMAVWNLGDVLPLHLKSLPPTLVYALGFLAYPMARLVGRRNAYRHFGVALAIATVARQAFGNLDNTTTTLAFCAWTLFLWWVPAWLERAARADARHIVPIAAATGVTLQAAGQTALHGLDVQLLRGPGGVVLAVALAAAFALTVFEDVQEVPESGESVLASAIALIGAWWFLELTLFANPGRVQQITGYGPANTVLLIAGSLALGVAVSTVHWWPVRWLAAGALLGGTAWAAQQGGNAIVLAVSHAAAYVVVAAACMRGRKAAPPRAYAGAVAGAGLFFVFIFGFYSNYEAIGLWTIAATALILCNLGTSRPAPRTHLGPAVLVATIGLLGALSTIVSRVREPVIASSPTDQLRVMSYNIHHGFDGRSLPGLQRIADVIANEQPDIVALQEVGRGWNLLGGTDVVTYLRWRFPGYTLAFEPTNGALWGNAILARGALADVSGGRFTASEAFRYGYIRGTLPNYGIVLYSVHLSADLDDPVEDLRTSQARELAALLGSRVIVAGDFNAEPNSPVITTLLQAGLTDAPTRFGLGNNVTWPSVPPTHPGALQQHLDYVFTSADLPATRAMILDTDASDHRPIIVDLPRPARLSVKSIKRNRG